MLFRAAQRFAAAPRAALLSRALATEAAARPPQSRQYAAVEDLHHRTAEEILQERDAAKASGELLSPHDHEMEHFPNERRPCRCRGGTPFLAIGRHCGTRRPGKRTYMECARAYGPDRD